MGQPEMVNDLLFVGQCDLYFMVQLSLENGKAELHCILEMTAKSDTANYPILNTI